MSASRPTPPRFQLTRPMRGATQRAGRALRAPIFQLTRPMRGATGLCESCFCPLQFQLTRPMRGATYAHCHYAGDGENFNSHAPCGARPRCLQPPQLTGDFNSHAPCGARLHSGWQTARTRRFQLTRPMRGATFQTAVAVADTSISTHTPHAGRDSNYFQRSPSASISTHTPHAGRDRGLSASLNNE